MCYAHAWHDGIAKGYGTPVSRASLERLRKLGVDSISLTPFGFAQSLDDDTVHLATNWKGGETDVALAAETRQAHALGLRVMLKPHIWIRHGEWIGEQRFASSTAFARWFASYRAFILHYADLAEAEHIEWLAIGTELKRAAARDLARWTMLIAEIRAAYHGQLTYAANWDEDAVVFWDLVDAVGVQEYEPPTSKHGASLDELRAGWQRIGAKLEALAKKTGKPLIVTELGYRAVRDAAIAPSTWPESERAAVFDGEHQALCYRAALEALDGKAWLRGVYLWKWFTDSADEHGPTDFSPAGKPAERVLGEFWRRR
jgi:hypothetical protein